MSFAGEQNPNYRHGLTDGGTYRHPIYVAWQNMRARCYNPNHEKYHRYGGRGIIVCEDWLKIIPFRDWAIASGWQENLTLDRKENDGNYEPSNCHWIPRPNNSRKKSTTKLTYSQACEIRVRAANGENKRTLSELFNVSHGTIWFVVYNWTWRPQE